MNTAPQHAPGAVAHPANGQPPNNPPANPRPAVNSAGQNGQPVRRRKRPQTDPMRPVYRPMKSVARPVVSLVEMNEKTGGVRTDHAHSAVPVQRLRDEFMAKGAIQLPVVMRRGDLKDLRHHVMRLQSRGLLDIQNPEQFAPPIRLHRRDPAAPPSGAGSHYEEEETLEDMEESKERERIEIAKEERRRIREENQAQIAPTGVKKTPAFQKKTQQRSRRLDTPGEKKARLIRYEEALPWHLEDFENKQTWVGFYEGLLSETYVMLTTAYDANAGDVVQMIPLERWYKFMPKSMVKSGPSVEQIEQAIIKKEMNNPSWLREREEKRRQQLQVEQDYKRAGTVKVKHTGGEPGIKIEKDPEDIDFNMEEDFADDEEGLNGLFEGEDTEVKEVAERVKREQLAASVFALRNEEEVYKEEERQKREEEKLREEGKLTRKLLWTRERVAYDSDEEISEDDSEEERRKAKEEEEKKKAEEEKNKEEAANAASGASTKGSNTPSGAHKPVDINKKKRPGSPNLSEASGNESSRKKQKKNKEKHGKSALNTGSDSEMTDAGKARHKLKLRVGGSPAGTPSGSRAGSPMPTQLNGSRAGSPMASPTSPELGMPPASEIFKTIPPEGMMIGRLIAIYKPKVPKEYTGAFTRLIKTLCTYDPERKWLTPHKQMPSEEAIQAALRAPKPKPRPAAPASSAASPS